MARNKPGESAGQNRLYNLSYNPSPPDTVCITLQIPNDEIHILNFMDALATLALWKNYPNDLDHTARLMAAPWRDIWKNATWQDECCPDQPCPSDDEYEEDMNLCENIRFQNGKLQVRCCGQWQDVDGQASQGAGGSAQPGESPQPAAGGGCQDYQGDMGGDGPWYVPTVVSSGDTIDLHDLSGIFYDAWSQHWLSPDDGGLFVVANTHYQFHSGSSQIPLSPVGKIVAKIGSVYYDIQPGPFTVPSGHSSDSIQLEMNTPTPAGSGGDVHFTITICNNQTASYCRDFPYVLSPSGFTVEDEGGGQFLGQWQAGVGFTETDGVRAGKNVRRCLITLTTPATNIRSFDLNYDYTLGDVVGATAGNEGLAVFMNGTQVLGIPYASVVTGTNKHVLWSGSETAITTIEVFIESDNALTPDQSGSATLIDFTINGTGTPPTVGQAC